VLKKSLQGSISTVIHNIQLFFCKNGSKFIRFFRDGGSIILIKISIFVSKLYQFLYREIEPAPNRPQYSSSLKLNEVEVEKIPKSRIHRSSYDSKRHKFVVASLFNKIVKNYSNDWFFLEDLTTFYYKIYFLGNNMYRKTYLLY